MTPSAQGSPLSSPTELTELHHLIGDVRCCVTSLASRYGDIPTMRRIVNAAEQLLNDVERHCELEQSEGDFRRVCLRDSPGRV